MKKNIIISFFAFILPLLSFSQTGPGGVGKTDGTSRVVLWLIADKVSGSDGSTITSWTDQSGYNNHFNAGNGAILRIGNVNGYNSFEFNGSNTYFERPYDPDLSPNSEFSVYTASKALNTNNEKYIYANLHEDGNNKYGFSLSSRSDEKRKVTVGKNTQWHNVTYNLVVTDWAVQAMRLHNNSALKIFLNSKVDKKSNSYYAPNVYSPTRIGMHNESNSGHFKGYIGEIILFNGWIVNVERVLVENYLAAKYGINLLDNDFYTQDDPANGDFDHNVAGIGKDNAGNSHTHEDSQGTGIIRINNPSGLDVVNEYLFWGENVKDATYDFVQIDPETYRLNTLWRVSETGDVGTVTLSVAANDINFDPNILKCATLKLVVSDQQNFANKTSYPLNLNNGIYSADNVSFNDGDYFNIEYSVDKTIWDGNAWSEGNPMLTKKAVFSADYDMNLQPSISTCSCEVQQGRTIHIPDNKYLEIVNDLINNGTIIVEHAGSLVQTAHNPSISNGHYILNKTATNLNHYYDYVYWSSPLNSSVFTMGDLVPGAWAYYEFNPSNQDPAQNPDPGWTPLNSSTTFTPAKGYAISAPHGYSGGDLNVSFEVMNEAFNTGDISIPITINGSGAQNDDDWNLIGNPYPSAIDFVALVNDNSHIEGSYYAWTNCKDLDNDGHHQEEGYTVYTVGSGSTAACNNTGMSTGRYINSGQGFFVEANADGNVTFKNSHRVTGNNNNFIGREAPKDRIWLDLTNQDESVFSQILIGFFPGATDAKDRLYDAHAMSGEGAYIYSINHGENFVIQGYSAWDDSERSIPLGFTTNQTGEYVIRINRAEGALENVNIYIHNLQDNTYHLLNDNSFRFHSDAGTFDDLFELVFSPRPLDTDKENLVEYQILTGHDGHFEVTAENGIKQITVFDLNGRQLHVYRYQTNPKRVALNLNYLAAGTYLLQIGFENQTTATEKIIR